VQGGGEVTGTRSRRLGLGPALRAKVGDGYMYRFMRPSSVYTYAIFCYGRLDSPPWPVDAFYDDGKIIDTVARIFVLRAVSR
jgi:hypothetical protein